MGWHDAQGKRNCRVSHPFILHGCTADTLQTDIGVLEVFTRYEGDLLDI